MNLRAARALKTAEGACHAPDALARRDESSALESTSQSSERNRPEEEPDGQEPTPEVSTNG